MPKIPSYSPKVPRKEGAIGEILSLSPAQYKRQRHTQCDIAFRPSSSSLQHLSAEVSLGQQKKRRSALCDVELGKKVHSKHLQTTAQTECIAKETTTLTRTKGGPPGPATAARTLSPLTIPSNFINAKAVLLL